MDTELMNSQPDQNTPPPISEKTRFFTKKRILILAGVLVAIVIALLIFILYKKSIDSQKSMYQNNAYSKYIKNDLEGAETLAKEGLQKFPDDTYLLKTTIDARSEIGNRTGKEKEAFEINKPYIDKAKEMGQNSSEIMITLGYAYETAGVYDEALSYYEKAIELNSKSASAYFHKGHVLAFLSRNLESREFYDKAYSLDPANPALKLLKGNMYQSEKNVEEALRLFMEVATDINANTGTRAEAYTAIAYLKSQLGQFQQSKEYAKEALRLDNRSSLASGLYGFNSCLLGEYNDGLPALNAALKLNPRISINYMFMGVVLRHIKNYPLAINFQTDGINRISEDNTLVGEQEIKSMTAKAYYELAQTYSLIPDEDKAIESITKAMSFVDYRNQLRKDLKNGNYFVKIKNSLDLNKLIN